jgi:hypothetical protein
VACGRPGRLRRPPRGGRGQLRRRDQPAQQSAQHAAELETSSSADFSFGMRFGFGVLGRFGYRVSSSGSIRVYWDGDT